MQISSFIVQNDAHKWAKLLNPTITQILAKLLKQLPKIRPIFLYGRVMWTNQFLPIACHVKISIHEFQALYKATLDVFCVELL